MINGSIVSVTDYADKSKRAKERRETRCDKSWRERASSNRFAQILPV